MLALMRRSVSQARYVLIGSCTLLFAFQVILVGQSAAIERSQAFGRMADLLPGFLQRSLGSKALLLATFKGTVSFGYFHPVVCVLVAVIGMYLTTEPAYEVERGLVDLELARAVPRHRLVTRSLVLAELVMLTGVILMALGTSAGARLFDAVEMDLPDLGTRARLLMNLLAVGSCFAAFALWLASVSKRWMTAMTTAVLTAVVAYLIDFLALGWRPMRAVTWISPFAYYRPLSIIAGDAPLTRDLAVLASAALVFTVAAYWQFQRRDL